MIPRSVRWRLPLSYAAIALLTMLTSGGVLMFLLDRYYLRQERTYLANNAQTMVAVMAQLLEMDPPPSWIESQLRSFAFLSQARVRLLDAESKVVADSGSVEEQQGVFLFDWDLSRIPATLNLTAHSSIGFANGGPGPVFSPVLPAVEVSFDPTSGETNTMTVQGLEPLAAYMYATSAVGTPFGFGLNGEVSKSGQRSNQIIAQPIFDPQERTLGYIELLEGPAYGRQVLEQVALGWAVSGGVAVLIAAAAGLATSRRITTPLSVLTEVTACMAKGDLAARAALIRGDELGLLARAFNDMADRVENTVETFRRFAADAAHQLQTPLTALRTNLELAPDDEFVREAHVQTQRLDMIAKGLLDLSRLESSVQTREGFTVFDLVPLMVEIGELYASRADQAGVAFGQALTEGPVLIRGDAMQVRQAYNNMLDNAVKFTPVGGQIRAALQSEGDKVTISVEDTGIGIPQDDLPYLFNRFYRGRNASSQPGSGLGLAIAKAVADNHRGSISVESIEGESTRICLELRRVG